MDQAASTVQEICMEIIRISLEFLEFPPTHTCDGEDLSPKIFIKGLNAASLAVMAVNPYQPSCCSFSPWIIWNIPPVAVIPPGIPKTCMVTDPVTGVQGMNDFGRIGYSGPCPPPGATHRVSFKVWGLDAMLDLAPGSTKHQLVEAMRGHVLQYGETVAMYRRS
jgi:Raf kinase inhibitor-like YbhB/YbcL family protein